MDEKRPWGIEIKAYCMLLHLSQLSGIVIPGAGLIMPIVMWAANKEDFKLVDQHGRNALNWMISFVIYALICGVLMIVKIGFLLLIALLGLNLVFVIIAAVKANAGELWPYPMSIQFLK